NGVGIRLYEQVSRRGAKCQCEMGGKNPVVILEDADMDLTVESTAQGAFGSSGQRCTATSRAIVVNQVADEFVERIVKRAQSMRIGDGNDPQTEMGPSVDESQFKTVLEYLNVGREDGATLLCGGERATGKGLDRARLLHRIESSLRGLHWSQARGEFVLGSVGANLRVRPLVV